MSQFEFGSFRFGWDAPSRISTSTVFLQEQSALLPGEPLYSPIPFLPDITDGSGALPTTTTADGYPLWKSVPSRCDLIFYEGDDVVIPLFFNDPDITGDDMSNLEWHADIRVTHNYASKLVAHFSIAAEYHPSDTGTDEEDVDDEYTKVELFLPRAWNIYWGVFEWEIYSKGVTDFSRFPPPIDWDPDATWPPADSIKTWLYGRCIICHRTTETDYLPSDATNALPPVTAVPALLTTGGFVVGPNGRVP